MAAVALSMLKEFGTTMTLTRSTGGEVNPITGEILDGTTSSITTTGLLKPYANKLIDGTRILSGDKELVLSNEQVPLPTDKPIIGGKTWSIIDIKTIAPDDSTTVCYFVQVR